MFFKVRTLTLSTSPYRHDGIQVLHSEGHVFDSISVRYQMLPQLLVTGQEGVLEHEDDLKKSDGMSELLLWEDWLTNDWLTMKH